ncbi:MAG: hypothetical protein ACE5D3_04275, partial [Candidatus Binatia bacterium]
MIRHKGAAISDRNARNKSGGSARVKERGHLKLLEEITVLVGHTEDSQEALEGVVRLMAPAMDCEVCSLYSYDPQTETLTLAATEGLPPRSIGRVTMSADEGLVGMVVKDRKPLSVE